jgi:hypothetical protein
VEPTNWQEFQVLPELTEPSGRKANLDQPPLFHKRLPSSLHLADAKSWPTKIHRSVVLFLAK